MAIVWNGNKGQLIVDGEALRNYFMQGNASMGNLSLIANGKVLHENEWSVSKIKQVAESDADSLIDYLNYLNQGTPDYSEIDWELDDDCNPYDWADGNPFDYGDW